MEIIDESKKVQEIKIGCCGTDVWYVDFSDPT